MREIASLRFLCFLAQKMLKSKNKGKFPLDFFKIFNNFYSKNNPSKMPLSNLRLQFLKLTQSS